MTKIGIYAPTYNTAPYVEEMIRSVQSQQFQDWTLAIIDDASTDNSYETALKAAEGDKRIIVKKREIHDGRIGYIKNETIKLFENVEYLVSIDSDDLIPNILHIFSNFLDSNKDIGALAGNFICFKDNKRWAYPHVANSGDFNPNTSLKYSNWFPLRFYRRNCYEKVKGYDNNLTSAIDYDLLLKLQEITKFHRIKEPISYYYRQHDIQVSYRKRQEQDLNAKTALERALKRRDIKGKVINSSPPFIIEQEQQEHFIWGS